MMVSYCFSELLTLCWLFSVCPVQMFLHMSHPAIQLVFLDGKALILSSDGRHLNVGTTRFLWKDSSGSGIFA